MEAGGGDSQVIVFMAESQTLGNQSLTSHSDTVDGGLNRINRQPSTAKLRNRNTLRRLSFSKPKSRNVEYKLPLKTNVISPVGPDQPIWEEVEKNDLFTGTDSSSSEEDFDDEEEEEEAWTRKRRKKIKWRTVIEWSLFLTSLVCLILSLSVSSLRRQLTWGLVTWKWCLMLMVTFSGRLCSGWVVSILVFLIERNFMLREKVLYFVYGLRRSIQNCVWLGLVLLAWSCMFNPKVHKKNVVVRKVFQLLVAVLIGATIWLVKIILVKTLASSFHVRTYFDRMKESVFHHYILETLSGIF